jgi:hypothetical protein
LILGIIGFVPKIVNPLVVVSKIVLIFGIDITGGTILESLGKKS